MTFCKCAHNIIFSSRLQVHLLAVNSETLLECILQTRDHEYIRRYMFSSYRKNRVFLKLKKMN